MPKKEADHKYNPEGSTVSVNPEKKYRKGGVRRAFAVAQPIQYEIQRLIKPYMEKQGFVEAKIILDWDKIVGPFLADHTVPERISFIRGKKTNGTLYLCTTSAVAPEIQHLESSILERVNTYFGYQAVIRISLLHTKVNTKKTISVEKRKEERKELPARYRELIENVSEETLRHSLERLLRSMEEADR